MPVTPLRFRRQQKHDGTESIVTGVRNYLTHCDRFIISAVSPMITNAGGPAGYWHVSAQLHRIYGDDWYEWLAHIGLDSEYRKTRGEIVQLLTDALNTDGLMDVDDPSTVISL